MFRKGEQWKKIHVAIDLETMQVLSVTYTDNNVNDSEIVKDLSNEIKGNIKIRQSLEIYSKLSLTNSQKVYDEIIDKGRWSHYHLLDTDNYI